MSEQTEKDFATLFNEARIGKAKTYRQIKEATGLSISYLCDIAQKRRQPPDIKLVGKIESVLGITDRRLQIAAVQSRKPTYAELEADKKEIRELLNKSFMTCESGSEGRFVRVKFRELEDAQQFHRKMVEIMVDRKIK